jgi:hypothetical protein
MAHTVVDLSQRGLCSGIMHGAVPACVLALTRRDCNATMYHN